MQKVFAICARSCRREFRKIASRFKLERKRTILLASPRDSEPTGLHENAMIVRLLPVMSPEELIVAPRAKERFSRSERSGFLSRSALLTTTFIEHLSSIEAAKLKNLFLIANYQRIDVISRKCVCNLPREYIITLNVHRARNPQCISHVDTYVSV